MIEAEGFSRVSAALAGAKEPPDLAAIEVYLRAALEER